MARLRYVRDTTPKRDSGAPSRKISHTVRSVRALYETEPEIAAAVLPRPLVPAGSPEVFVQFADVTMHLAEDRIVNIGAATVGVACTHEGQFGYYVLAMPMEGEFVVIGGREVYGEPKKVAKTEFLLSDTSVRATVTRHDITFLEMSGVLGEPTDAPKQFTEHLFCFKAMPATAAGGAKDGGFDGDVFLTRLVWERNYTSVRRIDNGQIVLRDSPFDPLIDVPVKRLIKMELAEGATKTRGEVVCTVPGEYLSPFLVQRYDDRNEGINVELASEGKDINA